jgi:hypothetical protein
MTTAILLARSQLARIGAEVPTLGGGDNRFGFGPPVKGLGGWLWRTMKRLIASWSGMSEGKVPRFRRRRVRLPSIALSHEHEVGVKLEHPTRMPGEPLADVRVLVRGVVVLGDGCRRLGSHPFASSPSGVRQANPIDRSVDGDMIGNITRL